MAKFSFVCFININGYFVYRVHNKNISSEFIDLLYANILKVELITFNLNSFIIFNVMQ